MKQLPFQDLLDLARSGNSAARDRLFEECRSRLRELAVYAFDECLGPAWDPSDAVQESMIEAYRDFSAFRGERDEEFFAWLRAILEHNLADRLKYDSRQKRRGSLGRSLEDVGIAGESLRQVLAAEQSSVSQLAMRAERGQRLQREIEALPRNQAMAVTMRYLNGMSLQEISEALGKSRPSIAGLLIRATRQLQDRLAMEVGPGA